MKRMKRLAFLILATLTPTLTQGRDGGTNPPAEPARTAVLAEFPIGDDTKQLLVVPVTFRGRTYPFCIDTGASHMVYDKTFEDQLGPSTNTLGFVTASGKEVTKWYPAPEATLGPLSLRTDESATCVDLAFSDQRGGPRIYGMIGMSVLRKYALTLDYAHKTIQFRHEVTIDEARALPIRFDELGSPLIDMTLPGEAPRPYMVDTGGFGLGGSKVDQATFDRLRRGSQFRRMYQSWHMDISGSREGRIGEVRHAEIGGVKLSGVHVSDSPNENHLLGLEAIRRLNWVFDFPRQKMTVTKVGWW